MNKTGFNIKSITEHFKKFKFYYGGTLVAVVLLVATFFAGGSISSTPQFSSNVSASVSSSYDEALLKTNNTQATILSEDDKSDNKPNDKKDEQSTTSGASTSTPSNRSENSTVQQEQDYANSSNPHSSQIDNKQSSSAVSPYSKEYYSNNSKTNSNNTTGFAQSSISNDVKDKYNTESVPEGKPKPVEPQDQEIEDSTLTCTISINCATILDNLDKFNPEKLELVPEDGWILKPIKVTFNEGESAYDLLVRVCKENKIHMSARWTPIYNSHYIEAINNIKEFDCPTDRFHNTSGWMYCVNDWYPNYGVSRYELKAGDIVEFNYTCIGLGADLEAEFSTGG